MAYSDPLLIRFGHRVKQLRLQQNISQDELAHRCGFYRTYIGMVERAERSDTPLLCRIHWTMLPIGPESVLNTELPPHVHPYTHPYHRPVSGRRWQSLSISLSELSPYGAPPNH